MITNGKDELICPSINNTVVAKRKSTEIKTMMFRRRIMHKTLGKQYNTLYKYRDSVIVVEHVAPLGSWSVFFL